MGARKKAIVENIEITKITNKIKSIVSPSELAQVKQGLRLLKVARETLIDGDAVHEEDLKKIGEGVGMRLKKAREGKSLSQETLEKISKVSQSTISKIEGGYRMISTNEAKSLAKALEVMPQFLIAGEK